MADKAYMKVTTEEIGDIVFAAITGKGIKLNPKNKYHSYKVSVRIPKSEAKRLQKIIKEFWEENRPKGSPKKPANFDSLVYKHKDGNYYINPHSQTEFDGEPVRIGIVDAETNKLDPEVFGKIGEGSTGRVSFNLTTYDEGVSMFLRGVQLINYVPYSGGSDGSNDFDEVKGGKPLVDGDGFKKKKKKKKNPK